VMVSMEGSERTDEVLAMYRRLSGRFEGAVGITLQAHLRRTPDDLEDALRRPGKIRLVKGAFEEPEEVAMARGRDLDDAYRSLLERLLLSAHPTSVSTHDPEILEHADRFVRENGLEAEAAEFEMLYGVQEELLEKMRALQRRAGELTRCTSTRRTGPSHTTAAFSVALRSIRCWGGSTAMTTTVCKE
ncbi:MAG: proline dehydrogenase family protein, partial [Chloroflexota bacterium]|nr:proline dehydrogenase family protein [Chloroflexota bacterium]